MILIYMNIMNKENVTIETVVRCPAQPVNMKSFVAFLYNAMSETYRGTIEPKKAKAIASLAREVNVAIANETARCLAECRMKELGVDIKPTIRNIESKKFD